MAVESLDIIVVGFLLLNVLLFPLHTFLTWIRRDYPPLRSRQPIYVLMSSVCLLLWIGVTVVRITMSKETPAVMAIILLMTVQFAYLDLLLVRIFTLYRNHARAVYCSHTGDVRFMKDPQSASMFTDLQALQPSQESVSISSAQKKKNRSMRALLRMNMDDEDGLIRLEADYFLFKYWGSLGPRLKTPFAFLLSFRVLFLLVLTAAVNIKAFNWSLDELRKESYPLSATLHLLSMAPALFEIVILIVLGKRLLRAGNIGFIFVKQQLFLEIFVFFASESMAFVLESMHCGLQADITRLAAAQVLILVVVVAPIACSWLSTMRPRDLCYSDDDVGRITSFLSKAENFMEYESFLISEGTVEDLLFWRAGTAFAERYRGRTSAKSMLESASDIFAKFLAPGAELFVANLPPRVMRHLYSLNLPRSNLTTNQRKRLRQILRGSTSQKQVTSDCFEEAVAAIIKVGA